jgi:hypothetical protein
MNTVINLQVQYNAGNFLTSFTRRAVLMETVMLSEYLDVKMK